VVEVQHEERRGRGQPGGGGRRAGPGPPGQPEHRGSRAACRGARALPGAAGDSWAGVAGRGRRPARTEPGPGARGARGARPSRARRGLSGRASAPSRAQSPGPRDAPTASGWLGARPAGRGERRLRPRRDPHSVRRVAPVPPRRRAAAAGTAEGQRLLQGLGTPG
jgi:hypothetical protein